MQTFLIAVLIVIAGLIGALLVCATSLINRARAANTTLRRIEETLLSMNRAKAVDPAVNSATSVTHSQPAEAGGTGFLTLRELKMMPPGGRPNVEGTPLLNGRRSPRTGVSGRPASDFREAIGRAGAISVQSVENTANSAVAASHESTESGPTGGGLATLDSSVEAATKPKGLDSSIEIPSPGPLREMPSLDPQKDLDEALLPGSQMIVTAVAHEVEAANSEMLIRKVSEVLEEVPVASIPPVQETFPEIAAPISVTACLPGEALNETSDVGEGGETQPTSASLDESRRKKKEMELLMIRNSRRRRARYGG